MFWIESNLARVLHCSYRAFPYNAGSGQGPIKFERCFPTKTGMQRKSRSYVLRGNMTVKRLITGVLALLVVAFMIAPSLMAQSLISGGWSGYSSSPGV